MDVPINYGAVVAAALAGYLIGGLWYGPLFGEAWRKLSGIAEAKPTPFVIVTGVAGSLVMSFVLSHGLVYANAYLGTSGAPSGLLWGFVAWLGYVSTVTVGSVLYENKPWKLWLLNNGYWLTTLLVMGVILAVWKKMQ